MSDFDLFVGVSFLVGVYVGVWVAGLFYDARVYRITEETELKLERAAILLRRAGIKKELDHE